MSTIKANAVTGATTDSNLALTGNGSGIVTIGDGNLKFPDADGSANEMIITNGSAQLSFTAQPTGGAWNIIGTAVASSSASLTITGLDSTYDTYVIGLSDCVPASDAVEGWFRVGDSSGIDTASADYGWAVHGSRIDNTTWNDTGNEDYSDAQMKFAVGGTRGTGTGTGEGLGGIFYLCRPGDGTTYPTIAGSFAHITDDGTGSITTFGGERKSAITLDRIQFLFSSGNIATGRMTVWGIAHA